MQLVHSQISVPEKVKKLTKRQQYHEDMIKALRRRQFTDFQTAANDPEVIPIEAMAKAVSPGYEPKFRK